MKFRPKNVQFEKSDIGRTPHRIADQRLPVKNMTDWGCTENTIKEPRYAERAYELCCPVGQEEYNKIVGQIQNVRAPYVLAKQKFFKDAFQTQDRIQSTPGTQLHSGRVEEKSRPFAVGRSKERK